MSWDHAIQTVTPHVVRIDTPTGYGTGFLSMYNMDGSWCGIATAAHVVQHADEWQEPIRIRSFASQTVQFLKSEDRVIFIDQPTDSAIILFLKRDLQLPQTPIGLLPMDQPCGIGRDLGWLGYPSLEPYSLCFFAGIVSARKEATKAYLIDGVAINGVSGGPVFHCPAPGEVQIIGSISAYHANRATGEALPGLLRAQDVSHFHDVAKYVRDMDEARVKKQQFEQAQQEKGANSPPDGTPEEVAASALASLFQEPAAPVAK